MSTNELQTQTSFKNRFARKILMALIFNIFYIGFFYHKNDILILKIETVIVFLSKRLLKGFNFGKCIEKSIIICITECVCQVSKKSVFHFYLLPLF